MSHVENIAGICLVTRKTQKHPSPQTSSPLSDLMRTWVLLSALWSLHCHCVQVWEIFYKNWKRGQEQVTGEHFPGRAIWPPRSPPSNGTVELQSILCKTHLLCYHIKEKAYLRWNCSLCMANEDPELLDYWELNHTGFCFIKLVTWILSLYFVTLHKNPKVYSPFVYCCHPHSHRTAYELVHVTLTKKWVQFRWSKCQTVFHKDLQDLSRRCSLSR
jgi:hypothetical protein